MALDREAIAVALFTRLQAALPQLKFSARRPIAWDQCPDQPALLLVKGPETGAAAQGMPTKWTLTYDAVIYTRRDEDPSVAHDTAQNQIILAVEQALERTAAEAAALGPHYVNDGQDPYTTLGGLCSFCRIAGTVETDGGGLGAQCVTIIPIEIQATA
jgi:hypothetical protein